LSARVAIIDDHQLLAYSLMCALQARGFEAETVRLEEPETLIRSLLDDPPDVVLLDMQLGGAIGSGTMLVGPFTEAGVRVLIVSGITDSVEIAAALEAGAVGHVSKAEPFDVLLDTAARVARGEQAMSDGTRQRLLGEMRRHRAEREHQRAPFEALTPREREVLRALCAGESVTSIATASFVSVPTVRTQVRAILLKLGVASQLEAVAQAHRCGWYDEPEAAPRSA
jgi:DNA-binding NarL/FixJ family response regulator